jgi:hypothetical protein
MYIRTSKSYPKITLYTKVLLLENTSIDMCFIKRIIHQSASVGRFHAHFFLNLS